MRLADLWPCSSPARNGLRLRLARQCRFGYRPLDIVPLGRRVASRWELGRGWWRFSNLGVTLALVGTMAGDVTGHSLLQLPRYVQPLLLVAYGAIATAGVLAWSGRRQEVGYACSGMFSLLSSSSLGFSRSHVSLFYLPLRGVLQAVASGWYAQGVITLWLAPLALAAAYYVVPKVTGRVLPAYQFSSVGFWTLIVIGSWTGGRHLIGGPVPAWISSLAIVSCSLLVFHYLIVLLNLRGAIGGGGAVLKLTAFGVLALRDRWFRRFGDLIRAFAAITQFTYFTQAQQHLALYGGISMMFFGALYFAVFLGLTGRAWVSGMLIGGHATLAIIGVLMLVISFGAAGWIQGQALLNPAVKFAISPLRPGLGCW